MSAGGGDTGVAHSSVPSRQFSVVVEESERVKSLVHEKTVQMVSFAAGYWGVALLASVPWLFFQGEKNKRAFYMTSVSQH